MKLWQECINDFGGYESAKKAVDNAYKSPLCLAVFNVEAMRGHLLEYRRANNIYEVGDPVIRLDGSTPSVYRVHEIYECGAIGIVRHPTPTRPHWTCLPSDRLRHATDEEIKAGHRL